MTSRTGGLFLGLIAILLSVRPMNVRAQDSVQMLTPKKDTVLIKSYAERYDPRRALLLAAVLPGLGQVYNKKYWKLPLVYGGFAGIGYGLDFYQKGYRKYREELFGLLDDDPKGTSPSGYNLKQLRQIVDKYRRERDVFTIYLAGMYLLQIVDAHVDAHLKEFDLNPDLKLSVEPYIKNDLVAGRQQGLSMLIKF